MTDTAVEGGDEARNGGANDDEGVDDEDEDEDDEDDEDDEEEGEGELAEKTSNLRT